MNSPKLLKSLPITLGLLAIGLMPLHAEPEMPADNPVLKERNETPEEHDARMRWFREARFGMFIHWGLYAQAGGEWNGKPVSAMHGIQEWIMCTHKIPREEYATLALKFNPAKYNAEKWVLTAKAAGMKYIVITAKHHEGFAMFKTAASRYNIMEASPFKRDPLKELAAACRKHGMKLGFYYSQNLDWYHPGGGSGDWDPSHQGDPEKYVNEIVIPQLREILKNYGDIAILWFDIPGGVINKERADRIQKVVLDCNPNIIMNNRLGGGYHGDTETPEQHIPATGFPGRDWESCMTMNGTWGYGKNDHDWKSTQTLQRNLCDIASKGGNYLLNVGPNEMGEIPAPSLERLSELGEWLKINGDAIYGTQAAVFSQTPSWGRFTTKYLPDGNSIIYAIVFESPADGVLRLNGLSNKVQKAIILGSKNLPVALTHTDGTTVTLPTEERGKKDFVVAIKLQGRPVLDSAIHAGEAGDFSLLPRQAAFTGSIKIQTPASSGMETHGRENLGFWTEKNSTVAWTLTHKSVVRCSISVTLSASEPAGSVLEFICGDQILPFTVPDTGGWDKYKEVSAGTLNLPAGTSNFIVRVKSLVGIAPCNLAKVNLTPLK
jgi:alpha-L-fucosidase